MEHFLTSSQVIFTITLNRADIPLPMYRQVTSVSDSMKTLTSHALGEGKRWHENLGDPSYSPDIAHSIMMYKSFFFFNIAIILLVSIL